MIARTVLGVFLAVQLMGCHPATRVQIRAWMSRKPQGEAQKLTIKGKRRCFDYPGSKITIYADSDTECPTLERIDRETKRYMKDNEVGIEDLFGSYIWFSDPILCDVEKVRGCYSAGVGGVMEEGERFWVWISTDDVYRHELGHGVSLWRHSDADPRHRRKDLFR